MARKSKSPRFELWLDGEKYSDHATIDEAEMKLLELMENGRPGGTAQILPEVVAPKVKST